MESADIITIGKHIKDIASWKNVKNEKVADIIGYGDGHQVSPIYSGKKELSEDQYKKLSKEWNIRVNYLKRIDDFMTDKEYQDSGMEQYMPLYDAFSMYLKVLGLTIQPKLHSYVWHYRREDDTQHIYEIHNENKLIRKLTIEELKRILDIFNAYSKQTIDFFVIKARSRQAGENR